MVKELPSVHPGQLPLHGGRLGAALIAVLFTFPARVALVGLQLCGRARVAMGSFNRAILAVTAIDFTSGCLLTSGLLIVGSGTYVVVYSSTTVWTAVIARLTGQVQSPLPSILAREKRRGKACQA